MELTQLQYFRTVARIQNITRAAKALHISQPALSRAISRLEEELDASLFERSGNRITLSPSGVAFLNRVDQIFKELDNGIEEVHAMQGDEHGTVNFAAFTSGLVSEPMYRLLSEYPNIHLNHMTMNHALIKEGLERGTIDIALTLFPVESTLVQWVPPTRDELIALVNCENPISQTDYLELADIKNEKLAIVASDFGIRDLLEGFCMVAGFSPMISYMGVDSEMAMSLVRRNASIFILPASGHVWKVESSMQSLPSATGNKPFPFRAMRFHNHVCSFQYGIAIPKDKVMSKATYAFYTIMREHLTGWDLRWEQEGFEALLDL